MKKAIAFDDRRRRHQHFLVTITYQDSGRFGRVYTDLKKAQAFAERQKKSPVVAAVSVRKVD
jgi:hypothetical protein